VATVKASVNVPGTNIGSFSETVLAPGPWSTVETKAEVGAKLGLDACTGDGFSTFTVNGKPDDAAMAASNRRHEDQHVKDDKAAFFATIGVWDAKLTAAAAAGTQFPGATQAAAEAAMYAAMGGTPEQIADAFTRKVNALGAAYHGTAAGGKVSVDNEMANDDCSTSSVDATNPA
jgi:hypothetical protein